MRHEKIFANTVCYYACNRLQTRPHNRVRRGDKLLLGLLNSNLAWLVRKVLPSEHRRLGLSNEWTAHQGLPDRDCCGILAPFAECTHRFSPKITTFESGSLRKYHQSTWSDGGNVRRLFPEMYNETMKPAINELIENINIYENIL